MSISKGREETQLQPNINGTTITKEESTEKKKTKNNLTNNKYKKASIENKLIHNNTNDILLTYSPLKLQEIQPKLHLEQNKFCNFTKDLWNTILKDS